MSKHELKVQSHTSHSLGSLYEVQNIKVSHRQDPEKSRIDIFL